MQTYIDCYPCVLRQAIEAARMANATPSQEREIVLKALDILRSLPEGLTPPAIGTQVHQVVREITGNQDPYAEVKQQATKNALSMLPRLKEILDSSDDRLETAVRLSIAGNIMDFGPNPDYDLWEVIEEMLTQDFGVNDLPILRHSLELANSILFLGDNAGEHVFDKLLIEALPIPVTYVVRGGAVLNDVTLDDALAVGIDEVAEVIDNGARVPGTILSLCNRDFQERFQSADLILAKGMGNYETLSEVPAPIFFLLKMKCPVIGRDLGAPAGSMVVKKGAAG
ncbi:MAG: ARMT1-like domain-containing protein [Chloroflexota bacterium]|jgi:uncharacterized protein with ATP-grasp and redox domains|nr:ARMT1-like domain-containing protein [Chloroflexota bacterium]